MDIDLIAKVAAPLVSLIVAAVIKALLEGRSRLVAYVGHVAAFRMEDAEGAQLQAHSHNVVLQNSGKKSATNVRVPHGVARAAVNIHMHPPVHYTIEENPAGNFQILIPNLAPKEQITISYLYQAPTVWSHVSWQPKSDDGLAELVEAIPAPRPNRFIRYTVLALAFVGLSYLFYWVVRYGLQSAA